MNLATILYIDLADDNRRKHLKVAILLPVVIMLPSWGTMCWVRGRAVRRASLKRICRCWARNVSVVSWGFVLLYCYLQSNVEHMPFINPIAAYHPPLMLHYTRG
jgi:hypothetical protein